MMAEKKNMGIEDQADVLLRQLMSLKRYETPEVSRMTRNKQNIMRHVRESAHTQRKSLVDRIEINIPWFFAEPKYGIAAVFMAFVGLQYVAINGQNASQSRTGIYTASQSMAALEQSTALSTNSISYPKLPDNMQLFPSERATDHVKFVGFIENQ